MTIYQPLKKLSPNLSLSLTLGIIWKFSLMTGFLEMHFYAFYFDKPGVFLINFNPTFKKSSLKTVKQTYILVENWKLLTQIAKF